MTRHTAAVAITTAILLAFVACGCRFADPNPGEGSLEYRLKNEAWSTFSEIYTPDRGYRVAFLPFRLVAHESGQMYETWRLQDGEFLDVTRGDDRHYRYRYFKSAGLFAYCRPGFPRPFFIARDELVPKILFDRARDEGLDLCTPLTVLRIAGARVEPSQEANSERFTVDLSHLELDRQHRAAIRDSKGIETLVLANAKIADVDLAYLSNLSSLTNLTLAGTAIGDDGLQYIVDLPLRRLDLSATRVSDMGIRRLQTIESLEEVYLRNTSISAEAIDELRTSRPNLTVHY